VEWIVWGGGGVNGDAKKRKEDVSPRLLGNGGLVIRVGEHLLDIPLPESSRPHFAEPTPGLVKWNGLLGLAGSD
jgi:hypothetical protein